MAERARRLVFGLPTVAAQTRADRGTWRLEGAREEESAFRRLVALGPDAVPALLAALEGKPIRGRALTALFRQCDLGLPEGATGIDLHLDRAGDDTGYVLRIAMTTHEVVWPGGEGGFILGGDGMELVDTFLRDTDSWWHQARSSQLDELLLAPPDEEVHVHRSIVRAREP